MKRTGYPTYLEIRILMLYAIEIIVLDMKKKIIGLIACILWTGWSQAQEMKEVFVDMPDSLSGVLTKVNRADCADFLASDMKAQVTNRYNRQSELKILTKDYLFLQVTPQVSWEMKLLPVNDTTKVVCLIRSVCAPVCDSKVEFYTADWKPLSESGYLLQPTADAFFLPTDSLHADSLAVLRKEADLTFLKASLSPDDTSLSYTYTTMDFVRKETAEKLRPYLRPMPLRYEWKEGAFKRIL